jgi:hypothetical protein
VEVPLILELDFFETTDIPLFNLVFYFFIGDGDDYLEFDTEKSSKSSYLRDSSVGKFLSVSCFLGCFFSFFFSVFLTGLYSVVITSSDPESSF